MTSKKKTNEPAQPEADEQPKQPDDATEQEPAEGDEQAASIKPVATKIREGPDNLRRRQEWFQKRSGRR